MIYETFSEQSFAIQLGNTKEDRYAYYFVQAKIREAFHEALQVEYGTLYHPKEQKLFEIAWDRGHGSGFQEVENYYAELAVLLGE